MDMLQPPGILTKPSMSPFHHVCNKLGLATGSFCQTWCVPRVLHVSKGWIRSTYLPPSHVSDQVVCSTALTIKAEERSGAQPRLAYFR